MEVQDCIHTRRSIRKFLEIPVEWDKVGQILDAGRVAPSSGNLQPWKFIVVQNEATRKALAEASLKQFWMENAPVFIIICAEIDKIKKFYGVRGERLYSVQNCAAAAQNMLLTAHSLGLGACFVAAFDENAISRVLGIPDSIRPQVIIPVGYSDRIVQEPQHYRIENVCFFEKWGNRIKDMDWLLWNFRVVERGVSKGKEAAATIGKATKESSLVKGLKERVRAKFKKTP